METYKGMSLFTRLDSIIFMSVILKRYYIKCPVKVSETSVSSIQITLIVLSEILTIIFMIVILKHTPKIFQLNLLRQPYLSFKFSLLSNEK